MPAYANLSILIVSTLVGLNAVETLAESCEMKGYWRADHAKTAKSIFESERYSPREKELIYQEISKSDLYGNVFRHYDCEKNTVFDPEFGVIESMSYDAHPGKGGRLLLVYTKFSRLGGVPFLPGDTYEEAIEMRSNCFKVITPEFALQSHYCRIDEKDYADAYGVAVRKTRNTTSVDRDGNTESH